VDNIINNKNKLNNINKSNDYNKKENEKNKKNSIASIQIHNKKTSNFKSINN
jgi:hypothetical protein